MKNFLSNHRLPERAGSERYCGLAAAEPDNPHDEFAVKIQTLNGLDLSYVPRSDNKAISRLIIAGLPLAALIAAIHPGAEAWQQVQVKVMIAV